MRFVCKKGYLDRVALGLFGVALMALLLSAFADPSVCPLDQGYSFGDVNGDTPTGADVAKIDISDLVLMVNAILAEDDTENENVEIACADVNCDANLNITDLVIVVSVILGDADLTGLDVNNDGICDDPRLFSIFEKAEKAANSKMEEDFLEGK